MTFKQKVVWSEGMFLRPQHFQQQERYYDFILQHRMRMLCAHYWGFWSLEIDEDALGLGVIAIRRAEGVFPDGTLFSIPEHTQGAIQLDVPVAVRSSTICLVVAPLMSGIPAMAFDDSADGAARHVALTTAVEDCNSLGGQAAEIQVGSLKLRLIPEGQVPSGWPKLGVIRVVERQPNNVVVVDRDYVPPCLCVKRQEMLSSMTREISGLLNQRVDLLSKRLSNPNRGGVTEISDFLLLNLANRWKSVVEHYVTLDGLHPERLYSELLSLGGELSSFSSKERRAPAYPTYDHDDLVGTFRAIFSDLRQSLGMVLEQSALRIELLERGYGVHMAQVNDRNLYTNASFVIAATANMALEQVRELLPAQVKIGPAEKIRDLVNLHLPGVGMRPLPVAPRELPYNDGYNYFEIDTGHELWRELARNGSLALHISGTMPGLKLECWVIKRAR